MQLQQRVICKGISQITEPVWVQDTKLLKELHLIGLFFHPVYKCHEQTLHRLVGGVWGGLDQKLIGDAFIGQNNDFTAD